jgi:hypothetical protein
VGVGVDGRGGRPDHGHDRGGAAARPAHPVGHARHPRDPLRRQPGQVHAAAFSRLGLVSQQIAAGLDGPADPIRSSHWVVRQDRH